MLLASWKLQYNNKVYIVTPIDADTVLQQIVASEYNAYTTLRTFNKKYVYWLNEHFRRLQHSALVMGRNSQVDGEAMRFALAKIMAACPDLTDYRIRIYYAFDEPYGTAYVQVHDLVPPAKQAYLDGVRCVTRTMHRNSPKAKLSQFMPKADEVRSTLPEGIHEAIMLTEDGAFLEGISSNFYAIMNAKVYTAEDGVLGGIVRKMVLHILEKEQILFVLNPAKLSDLPQFEEAFITSSTRGVLPVVEIDGQKIGDGKPGRMTKAIMDAYTEYVMSQLEPIQ